MVAHVVVLATVGCYGRLVPCEPDPSHCRAVIAIASFGMQEGRHTNLDAAPLPTLKE